MTNMFSRSFILALVIMSLFAHAGLVFAAEKRSAKKIPTSIQSSRMEYDANAQTVLFSGNVHVKRTDFELWAEKMTVYLEKSGQKNTGEGEENQGGMEAGDINRITAEKNVRMKSEGREGTCQKATYYAKEDKFVMEGAPRLWDSKQSTITGGTIVHYLSSNRSEVLNSAGVTFYAPDKTDSPTPLTIIGGGQNQ